VKIEIISSTIQNKDYAKANKVWQTRQKFWRVKVGDAAFIKVVGWDEELEYLGIVDRIERHQPLDWPDGWSGTVQEDRVFTLRFRDVSINDFMQCQHSVLYEIS